MFPFIANNTIQTQDHPPIHLALLARLHPHPSGENMHRNSPEGMFSSRVLQGSDTTVTSCIVRAVYSVRRVLREKDE